MGARIPTIVLGGTGYVAGELLRLIAGHPNLELAGILSDSQPGEPVAKSFGHPAPVYPDTKFASIEEIEKLVATLPRSAVFSAAPHGASAALINRLLTKAEAAGTKPSVVDISADYRFATNEAYAAVYKHDHGAPNRLRQFTCAVPEHLAESPTPHIGHPGCFSTAILLASVPLLKLGIATPVSATVMLTESSHVFWRTAARMPSGTPIRIATPMPATVSWKVAPTRSRIIVLTGWLR